MSCLHCEYCVSKSAIRKSLGQKESIVKGTELVPRLTIISTFCVCQAYFPELEDQLILWVDTMRHSKLELPPTLVMAKALEIVSSLNIDEMNLMLPGVGFRISELTKD